MHSTGCGRAIRVPSIYWPRASLVDFWARVRQQL
jgi:hypothetical protein